MQKEIQFISKKKKLNYMFQSRILFVISSIRVFETLISRYLRAWNVKTMTLKKQFKCILLLKMATIAFFWHIYKYHWFVLSYNILKENWFCYKIIRYFPQNMIWKNVLDHILEKYQFCLAAFYKAINFSFHLISIKPFNLTMKNVATSASR